MRMEPYEAPQLNVLPFKLLLLKKDTTTALSLFAQTLKIISCFFDISHLELDKQAKKELDIRRRLV